MADQQAAATSGNDSGAGGTGGAASTVVTDPGAGAGAAGGAGAAKGDAGAAAAAAAAAGGAKGGAAPIADAGAAPAKGATGGVKTVAEDPSDPAKVSGMPDNWREIAAGGNAKDLARLARFGSIANVWAQLRSLENSVEAGKYVPGRPETKDEAKISEWRETAGIPAKPEGYLEKLPNGLVIGKEDQEYVGDFLKEMHSIDAKPAEVHKALGFYYAHQERLAAQLYADDMKHKAETEDNLRGEWGNQDYRSNLAGMKNLFGLMAPQGTFEMLFGARLADGRAVGNTPEILKFLSNVSRSINPNGVITPQEGQTITETAKTELQKLDIEMADTRSKDPNNYWNNKAKQDRYRELLNLVDKHSA